MPSRNPSSSPYWRWKAWCEDTEFEDDMVKRFSQAPSTSVHAVAHAMEVTWPFGGYCKSPIYICTTFRRFRHYDHEILHLVCNLYGGFFIAVLMMLPSPHTCYSQMRPTLRVTIILTVGIVTSGTIRTHIRLLFKITNKDFPWTYRLELLLFICWDL